MTAMGELDECYGYNFCWFWGSLQTLLAMMGRTLQKFITNSHFVEKIQFQLLSPFLSLFFVREKN